MLKELFTQLIGTQLPRTASMAVLFENRHSFVPPKESSDSVSRLTDSLWPANVLQLDDILRVRRTDDADLIIDDGHDSGHVTLGRNDGHEVKLVAIVFDLLWKSIERVAIAFDFVRVQGAVHDGYVDASNVLIEAKFFNDKRRSFCKSFFKSWLKYSSNVAVAHESLRGLILGNHRGRVDTFGHCFSEKALVDATI